MKALNRLLGLPVYEDTSPKLDVLGEPEAVKVQISLVDDKVSRITLLVCGIERDVRYITIGDVTFTVGEVC